MDASAPHSDTIFALSSGGPPAGVAVVRLSGALVRFVLETIIGAVPPPRHAALKTIRSRDGSVLDRGLVIYFPAPTSFTGEECAELHVHGGRAVIVSVLNTLESFDELRHAEAGEFTRRAFENGRVGLTEVEGLADLIAAQTEVQRRVAAELAGGGLARLYDEWARRLTHARAMIEAEFDFADEDDVPGSVSDRIWTDMHELAFEVRAHLHRAKIGERVRDGFQIAIVGPPNAGKSSLLNVLARRDVAIVSAEAGTTRDVLSVDLDVAGYPATISDTAGLRRATNAIELEGIRRAERAMETADLVLELCDVGGDKPALSGDKVWRIGTKTDLHPPVFAGDRYDFLISSTSGAGIDELLDAIKNRLQSSVQMGACPMPNRMRHRTHLAHCLTCLETAIRDKARPIELRAEDLRLAGNELGRLTGRVDAETLLDVIFAEFCIGK